VPSAGTVRSSDQQRARQQNRSRHHRRLGRVLTKATVPMSGSGIAGHQTATLKRLKMTFRRHENCVGHADSHKLAGGARRRLKLRGILCQAASTGRLDLANSTNLTISIVLANGAELGPAKIALLEAIESQGSITSAARSLGISSRTARRALEYINSSLCSPAIATDIGGLKGGGAALTPTGARLVVLYRAIQVRARGDAANELQELDRVGGTPLGPRQKLRIVP
jgi:molybdate transport system regulatory protein